MHEVLKNVTLDEHAYLFAFWWMSDQWLKALPADLQDLVIDCVAQASQIQSDWNKEYEARSLNEFREAGGTVYVPTAEEKETFLVARDAMKGWFREKYGDEWLTAFEKAVADAEAGIKEERDRIIGRN